ncbi:MAG: hypothetical protein IKC65_00390 [Lentisphaeria bacterium]|nr:hypothetical protein [Lentisphaeria bacterium]
MKRSALLLAALIAGMITVQAEEKNDINGSFEKCRANSKGFISPEGWVKDKQSKGVKFSATSEEVRSGKFSLYIENEEKASSLIYYYPSPVKAEAGDKMIFTVYGKGEGSFNMGVIAYSDEAPSRFLRTLATREQKITDGEKWQKFTFVCPVNTQKRYGKEYQKFLLRPVILIRGAAEFALDDLIYEKKGKSAK